MTQQRAEEVDVERGAGLLLAELLDGAEPHRPGVVDDDVEPAEAGDRLLDRGEDGGAVGDVGGQRQHAVAAVLVGEPVELVGAAGQRGDAIAGGERGLGEGAAKAAAGAGDQPDAAGGGFGLRGHGGSFAVAARDGSSRFLRTSRVAPVAGLVKTDRLVSLHWYGGRMAGSARGSRGASGARQAERASRREAQARQEARGRRRRAASERRAAPRGPRPAAGARRSEASRRAILSAAFELVGEVGYERLTIEGIAARAGVGKQTIYRWWPSKGVVLFDAFLALSENQEGEVALPDSGDLDADLKLVLRATVAELADPRYDLPMRALAAAMLADATLAAEYERRLDGPMRTAKRARLAAARAAGQLPAGADLDLAVDLLWSPLWRRWQDGGELTPAFADALVETVLAGLRAR